ncbi:hypothetical protein COOONC_12630 [Cooperia oncophora]
MKALKEQRAIESVWCGTLFNCIVLALNRVVEMIPSAHGLRFLFQGKMLYCWMVLSVAYMLSLPFVNRTNPFNTAVSAYIPSPVITDDHQQLLGLVLLLDSMRQTVSNIQLLGEE